MIIAGPVLIGIVDDDLDVLEALGSLLESAGYSVLRFRTAQCLLDSRHIAELDCVISDIGMPGMDGIALQAALYRLRPEVPVILITGRDDSDERPVRRANNRGYLLKPFDIPQLLDTVASAVIRSS